MIFRVLNRVRTNTHGTPRDAICGSSTTDEITVERARRGAALSLSLCVSRGDREGERSGGVRSRSRRLETHSHACRALPPPPDRRKPSVPSVSSPRSPRVQPTDRTSEGRRPRRDPFSRFPRTTPIVSLSLSLSFHPRCCCCCRCWWVLTPPSPTRRALPLTASPFPKRSAGSLQTTPPPPLTHPSRARHRGGGPRSRGARARAQKPKLGAGRGDVWGDSGAEAASRLSEGEGERGGALLCRPPPRPASLFRVFQVQILNSSSKIQQVFRSKWARTEREREREREGGSCARCIGRGEGKRHRLGERRGAARKIEPGRGRGGGL